MLKKFFFNHTEAPPTFIDSIEDKEQVHIIRLKGPIDMFTIPSIQELKEEAEKEKGMIGKNILLNFGKVTHIDGATCALLLNILSELKQEKHKLVITNASEELKNMMEISKIGELFLVYETETQGLEELKKEEV
ncbi:MAG: STAS domain-containing protein [Candidatus Omnitrophota bacterium]|nr:STAS domain-containing protein [Candidatus Omnitrophota bacterium]